ncbi:hypothetical protein TNIN_101451 [Trichonephila inaurata madagascariensis]|uniref:Uncharacterized protein n=1 Tax=Trichonephila inaurata madagascariensis TaxID=2747483 RepID=A0A8X6I7S8_9ARAC|nr:hypothetical protein TNIN_101451 [Trichonephila inaurata madagascariensis]
MGKDMISPSPAKCFSSNCPNSKAYKLFIPQWIVERVSPLFPLNNHSSTNSSLRECGANYFPPYHTRDHCLSKKGRSLDLDCSLSFNTLPLKPLGYWLTQAEVPFSL